jgi:hypothetical protein
VRNARCEREKSEHQKQKGWAPEHRDHVFPELLKRPIAGSVSANGAWKPLRQFKIG